MIDLRKRRTAAPLAVGAAVAALGATLAAVSGGTADAAADPAVARHNEAVVAARGAALRHLGTPVNRAARATDERRFGDLTLDGRADLAAIDAAGALWVYPGREIRYAGTGPRPATYFTQRHQFGSGWGGFTNLVRHGDWNSDGRQDVLARDPAGRLLLFVQAGADHLPKLANAREVGTGWTSFASIAGAGDLDGDGHDDLLGQKSDGTLLLFAGTGNGVKPFAARGVQIGTGWRGDLLTPVGDWSGDGRTEFLFRNTRQEVSLYTSRPGPMPIGARTLLFDAVEGAEMAHLAGAGDLTSDTVIAGTPVQPLPDAVIRWTDGRLSVLAMDTAVDFDGAIGTGWGGYRVF